MLYILGCGKEFFDIKPKSGLYELRMVRDVFVPGNEQPGMRSH
jgi:hypothetical protein